MKKLILIVALTLIGCSDLVPKTTQELEAHLIDQSIMPPQGRVIKVYNASKTNPWVIYRLEKECFLLGGWASSRVMSKVDCP